MLIDVQDVTHEQIDHQIKIRKDLIGQMVGSLYPSILSDEIVRLESIKSKMEKLESDFINETEMGL